MKPHQAIRSSANSAGSTCETKIGWVCGTIPQPVADSGLKKMVCYRRAGCPAFVLLTHRAGAIANGAVDELEGSGEGLEVRVTRRLGGASNEAVVDAG